MFIHILHAIRKFVEAHEPMRLKDGDIVMIGGSELRVGIVNVDDDEH